MERKSKSSAAENKANSKKGKNHVAPKLQKFDQKGFKNTWHNVKTVYVRPR